MAYGEDIKVLEGKTLVEIHNNDNRELLFFCDDGAVYRMYHSQDCCESVWLEDIVGDLVDLVAGPILLAEEVNNVVEEPLEDSEDSYTWTFYKLVTNRGAVTLRWYGTSNGDYSEAVDFELVTPPLVN